MQALDVNQSATVPPSGKAERTRSTILAAAEELFATRGYAATRLEDVADTVGLTRAALFYYFRDKQALYDAMLENAFGSFTAHLNSVLTAAKGSITERIELAVEAWVDAIAARPSLARLILRYVADVTEQPQRDLLSTNDRMLLNFWSLFEQGRKSGELRPVHDDPFHAASAIIGTTVFYVAGLSALVRQGKFEPLDPRQVAAHKREALFAVRHLLGIASRDN
jgi:TetR/AcrR family transcriptional regulator